VPNLETQVKIVENLPLKQKGYYLLTLLCPYSYKSAQPGQFVHVRINNTLEPFLRRPFSIHRVESCSDRKHVFIKILYEIVGKGTFILAQKKANQQLDILGPNGHGFEYEDLDKRAQPIIIAGGMGVAPLLFLAEKILNSLPYLRNKPIVLIGAKTKDKIVLEKEFRQLGCRVNLATDDGSIGFKGSVISLFKKELRGYILSDNLGADKKISIFACGPRQMLCELAKICELKKIALQVSLEEFMGCGIGACLGCAIETKHGFRRVCYDGPVFWAEDIVWKS